MNAYEKEINEKDFEDTLNCNYGTVTICGMEFDQGSALKELDPIAFRVAMADEPIIWVCDECESEYETEDEAEECCPIVWVCNECESEYKTEDEAEECCSE